MDDPARIQRDLAACTLANNNTIPPDGPYCAGTFDTWLCWPHTRANTTVTQPCPGFVPGFSTALLAHKECRPDGTWWRHPETDRPWSNYTTCVPPEDDMNDIIVVYEVGYSVSLVALLLSLAILLYFKNLRCARITVHMNLFVSFALNNALWLWWYGGVVRAPGVLRADPAWCRALAASLQYALLTNYAWMLCEGLYLHTVLVSAFVAERRLVRALAALGWAAPALPAAIHAALRATNRHTHCWATDDTLRLELALPAALALLLNLGFLINIVRVLCGKLRARPGVGAGGSRPGAALAALRATCLLAPLLGLHFLLTPFRPARGAPGSLLYEHVAALAASLQGLLVAALYCLCNGEVLAQVRRRVRALTFRPRANSATATTTTVSFVRSTAPPNEEKV